MYIAKIIFTSSVLFVLSGCTKTLIVSGWSSEELAKVVECNGVNYSTPSVIYLNSNARNLTEAEIKSYSIHAHDKLNESPDNETCPAISINGIEQYFESFRQNQCNYSLMDYSELDNEIKFDIDIKGCDKKSYKLRKYQSEQQASSFPT